MEQLKIGDKVEILWEKTKYKYSGILIYKSGVIVDKQTIDDDNGKPIEIYMVDNIYVFNEKYALYFTKEQLAKIVTITDITKYLEPKITPKGFMFDIFTCEPEVKFEEVVLSYTLPTKVVFDINKRKTTLLFGDKPYEHKVSGIAHKSDKFDTASGFFIQLAKHILKDKWQDKMQMWEYLSNSDFETVKMMIFNFVLTHLKEELGMSFRQLDKLSKWNYKAPLTFEINGIKHTIEVEHKLEKVIFDEIPF